VATSEAPDRADAERRRDRWRLGLAALGVLLAAADTYVVVVALPSIMGGVGVGLDRLQRATPILSGFLLGYTAVLPLIGRLADLAGTEPVFTACLAAFGTGSVLTATAHSLPVVVAGRALQGLGGGGLVPVTLSMVASRWPPDARGLPLGIVGAVQELGSVVGPLYGAEVVSLASWRAIFWINVPVTAALAAGWWLARDRQPHRSGRPGSAPQPTGSRRDVVGAALAVLGAAVVLVGLDAPSSLATGASTGQAWSPAVSGPWAPLTTPIVLVGMGLLVLFAGWELTAPGRIGIRPLVPLARVPAVLAQADVPGALLVAGVLGCVVVMFSTANPGRQVIASSAPVLVPVTAIGVVAFWFRQRRAANPLVDPGDLAAPPAWGALAVNVLLGAALMAALVDIPLFARGTVYTSDQVASAFVLVRFLVAVPIGAVLGGTLCRHRARAPYVAAVGLALAAGAFVFLAMWSQTAIGGGPRWSDVELVIGGLGFGLAIAPLNVALLGAVRPGVHALASALAVVARTIGMLAGLSALTAIALRRFYEAQSRLPSPFQLCPTQPASCPRYNTLTTNVFVSEMHTIFAGAAVCAGAAALLALVLLGIRPSEISVGGGGTTTWSARRPGRG
jgi:MFS family permease